MMDPASSSPARQPGAGNWNPVARGPASQLARGAQNQVALCDPFQADSDGSGDVTTYWAQEAVGGPELMEWASAPGDHLGVAGGMTSVYAAVGIVDKGIQLSNIPDNKLSPALRACKHDLSGCAALHIYPSARNPDDLEANHGTYVADLVGAAWPVGIGAFARISQVSNDGKLQGLLPASEPLPVLLNRSMSETSDLEFADPAQLAAYRNLKGRAIVVGSSGNDFPRRVSPMDRAMSDILVGNLEPDGSMSPSSQEDDRVVISAPGSGGGTGGASLGPDGRTRPFGGTSGAAPLVTAALANVGALLPGIRLHELQDLLRRTAVPVAAFINEPVGNGAGALNAYKLLRVASRLRKSWPTSREALTGASVYDFERESKRALRDAKAVLALAGP